jgi:rhamnulokinase
MLAHLAEYHPRSIADRPFDPRFLTPGDMPLKIQAFCRKNRPAGARKPGPYSGAFLSTALHYRRVFEVKPLYISKVQRLYMLPGWENSLLHHSIANALHVHVTILPQEASAMGNVALQAVANRHIDSLEHAQQIVSGGCKMKTIVPRGAAWDGAYVRFSALSEHVARGSRH